MSSIVLILDFFIQPKLSSENFFFLLMVFIVQKTADSHFSDDIFNGEVKTCVFRIVGRIDKINSVFHQQVLNLAVLFSVNRNCCLLYTSDAADE